MSAFAPADATVVLVDGKPAGVVTRQDVLAYWGRSAAPTICRGGAADDRHRDSSAEADGRR